MQYNVPMIFKNKFKQSLCATKWVRKLGIKKYIRFIGVANLLGVGTAARAGAGVVGFLSVTSSSSSIWWRSAKKIQKYM